MMTENHQRAASHATARMIPTAASLDVPAVAVIQKISSPKSPWARVDIVNYKTLI